MTAMHRWRSYSTATVWNDHALANWSLTWHADSSYLRHTWLASVSDPASHKEYVPISLVLIAPTFQHGLPAWITDQVQQKPTSMKKTSLKAGHETETPSKYFSKYVGSFAPTTSLFYQQHQSCLKDTLRFYTNNVKDEIPINLWHHESTNLLLAAVSLMLRCTVHGRCASKQHCSTIHTCPLSARHFPVINDVIMP